LLQFNVENEAKDINYKTYIDILALRYIQMRYLKVCS